MSNGTSFASCSVEIRSPIERLSEGAAPAVETGVTLSARLTGVSVTICINALDRVIRLDHAVIDIPWCHRFSWLECPWRKRPREQAYLVSRPSGSGVRT